ncbi:hypothetical protein DYB25_002576 [Aphanomyces astaci]|uniref:Uncharacterized protein n=1 Tax=Aphanomyces astaci TaxID=112090 RepID=A0A397ALH8_APHAT|nr:hypothetical protein DYB25_002576 [Aphanomyces astaci]
MEAATSDVRVENAILHGGTSARRPQDRKRQQQHHHRQPQPHNIQHQHEASVAKRHPSKVAPVPTASSVILNEAIRGGDGDERATGTPFVAGPVLGSLPDGYEFVQSTLHKWAAVLTDSHSDDDDDGDGTQSLCERFVDPTASELSTKTRTAIAMDLVSEMMFKMLPLTPGMANAVVHTLLHAIYDTHDPHADWRDHRLHVDRIPIQSPPAVHSMTPPSDHSSQRTATTHKVLPVLAPSSEPLSTTHWNPPSADEPLDLTSLAQQWNDLVVYRCQTTGTFVDCVDMLPGAIQRDLAQVLATKWMTPRDDGPSTQRLQSRRRIKSNEVSDSDGEVGGSNNSDDEDKGLTTSDVLETTTTWEDEEEGELGAAAAWEGQTDCIEDEKGEEDGGAEVVGILLDVYRLMLINNPRAQRQARQRLQSVLLPLVGDLSSRGGGFTELTGDADDEELRQLVAQLIEDDPISLVDLGLT